jgi:S1-C subfamily serine protease
MESFLTTLLNLVLRPFRILLLGAALVAILGLASFAVVWILNLVFSVSDLQYKNDLPPFVASQALPDKEEVFEAPIRLADSEGRHICSGFVVSDSYAITAAHCVDGIGGRMTTKNFKVFGINREDTGVEADAVGMASRMDMGLVRGDFKRFKKLMLDTPPIGFIGREKSAFVSCGFPMGDKILCVPQIVIGSDYFGVTVPSPVYPGMSGGPVIDLESGTAVGIISRVADRNGSVMAPIVAIWSSFGIEQREK